MPDPAAEPSEAPAPIIPPPDPFARLRREGWPAGEGPYRDLAAGRITREHALTLTLNQVMRDWSAFWKALRVLAPGFAHELGRKLAGNTVFILDPPLAPERVPTTLSE